MKNELKYTKIKKNDIANGPGIRVSFWTQGCDFRCEGCHNSCVWDFEGGIPYTSDTVNEVIEALTKNGIMRNFSVLGGEPLHSNNVPVTLDVLTKVKQRFPDINIWLWTGYTLEELADTGDKIHILSYIDVLVDGRYIQNQRDLNIRYRGSRNQRVIDMKQTLKDKKIILWEE